jgi:thioesterase domain-containing protein
MGDQQPFYGVQASGVDGRSEPFDRLEQMASAYLGEVRQVQPHGPYLLSGYCGGGAVAFEMARLLREAGAEVALVALLDTYRPGLSVKPTLRALQRSALARGGVSYLAGGVVRRVRRTLAAIGLRVRIMAHRARGVVPHELRDSWLTHRFFSAIAHYRPQPYAGRLTIFRARDVHPALVDVGPELGWSGLAAQGIDAREVAGDHDTLLAEANAGALAAELSACLAEAGRPRAQ